MKRRTFLTTALVGTGALALGVNVYSPPAVNINPALDNPHRLLFSVLLPVILDGAFPTVESHRLAAQTRTLDAIEQTISVLPQDQREELMQLLELLEQRLGLLLLTGNMTPLMMRNPQELAALLESWRGHYLDMMVTAYGGLRDLIMASYYSCPEHWHHLHYDKPKYFES
ncbi:twin-arginine translocation signal domain-containing protein [Shewanella sp. Scap07]|uniref:twin-arginine translocation signal domain-containing protein n=1 Tax=Shewanella sp. Scap07 TaxID=2589987 RepID=UPI0015C16566|nr:twin-arginine translocation signal domain-containing protein [Shewanella sp. Scap07]QLE86866.1 twin-arginine translocation signal domain-containing protein [Shewanella sp. Scap07]